ncbi:MAG: T9SS type A sorting domain-containing protein [Bacteroidales bacterium]|nr:T9SS type A sorting domain-containing protein [Bacteroidales bacterium]
MHNYFEIFTLKGDSLFFIEHHFFGGMDRTGGLQMMQLSNTNPSPIVLDSSLDPEVLSHTDSCLYAGDSYRGLIRLDFDGAILGYHNTGLPIDSVYEYYVGEYYYYNYVGALALTENYVFCGTNNGVYRTNENLENFYPVNNGLSAGRVSLIKTFNDSLYCAINGQLFMSQDFGDNWTNLLSVSSNISCVNKTGNIILVGTEGSGLFRSSDNGTTWLTLNNGLPELNIKAILTLDSLTICGTNTCGAYFLSEDVWQSNNEGMVCSFIRDLTSTKSNIVALQTKNINLYSSGVYTDITPNITNDIFLNIDNMGDTIFVSNYFMQSSWPYVYQFFHYTFDNGNIWYEIDNLPYTLPAGNSEHSIYIKDKRIYGYSEEKLYYSDNVGETWTNISIPSQYCNDINDFLVFDSIAFTSACGDAQLLKLDDLNNWSLSNYGLPPSRSPHKIANCDSALFTYILVEGMYVSFDNGVFWEYAGYGLELDYFGITDFVYVGNFLIVSTSKGLFYTGNFGQNWYQSNDGLINKNVSSLEILNDTLYAGTYGNGVWKQSINDLNLQSPEYKPINIEDKIFPNPASLYLFVFPKSNEEYYQIIDLMGNIVLEGDFKSGNKINISTLNNGMYLLNIKGLEKSRTEKIVISK